MAWRAGYCLLAAALLALPAAAGDHAYLNILITVAGSSPTPNIPITGLVASTAGALPGTINLAWTEPTLPAGKPPLAYDIRISSTGQITNNSDFSAALPLSAFSSVPLPPPGPGNNQALLAVPGLQPAVTYYFAVREYDSGAPMQEVNWVRDPSRGWNVLNYAVPPTPRSIGPIVDLVASTTGALPDTINLAWTEPSFVGTIGQRYYDIRVSTTDQMSDNPDYNVAQRLALFSPVAIPQPGPGGHQALLAVPGLRPGVTYYFAIRECDSSGPPRLAGDWRSNLSKGWNVSNFAMPYSPPAAVDPVADLAAAPRASEGDVQMTWTAPRSAGGRGGVQSFDLRYATFSAAGLGQGAEAWFAAASNRVSISTSAAVGISESYILHGLFPDATYYFAIKSITRKGDVSAVDLNAGSAQAQAMPHNLPPATPTGLAAAAGVNRALLTWSALTSAQKGLDFSYYRILRSTQAGQGFVSVATTTNHSYTDLFLKPAATYYYEVSARDLGGLESAASTAAAVAPFGEAPMAPWGIRTALSGDGSRTTFSWLPVRSFMDGTPFVSLSAPTADELEGYRILRSTTICAPNYVLIATVPANGSAYTDFTRGDIYYYQIQSYNSAGASSATAVVSGTGEQSFFLEDCRSRVVISDAQSAALHPATNGLGTPISIERRARPEDCGAGVTAAAEFNAVPRGGAPIRYFHFDQPAQVVLHYTGGAAVAAQDKAMVASGSVAMYWYDGREYRQIYAKVDTAAQTVTAQTPNLGLFEVRPQAIVGGAFAVTNISDRVITPNGDGLNDLLIISYVPGPDTAVVSGKIYDLKGGYVADMSASLGAGTLNWDGKMNGRVVAGGVYAYEIKGGGKKFTGTVVVAR